MSTYVWRELVCEYCSISICGQFSTEDRIPRSSLKKEAAENGAVFSGDDVFCCENHRARAQPKSIRLSSPGTRPAAADDEGEV